MCFPLNPATIPRRPLSKTPFCVPSQRTNPPSHARPSKKGPARKTCSRETPKPYDSLVVSYFLILPVQHGRALLQQRRGRQRCLYEVVMIYQKDAAPKSRWHSIPSIPRPLGQGHADTNFQGLYKNKIFLQPGRTKGSTPLLYSWIIAVACVPAITTFYCTSYPPDHELVSVSVIHGCSFERLQIHPSTIF